MFFTSNTENFSLKLRDEKYLCFFKISVEIRYTLAVKQPVPAHSPRRLSLYLETSKDLMVLLFYSKTSKM